ncbi:Hpt domain-containing protein [Tsuneonella sp. YG55]|uniref:Hpt domain-containing protein n=1 Tax=Tsuneonella litorea TaxID=2976475 RepID=A0A9X2W2E0_9SPHN|nr:Hpt domain-containing protein [Tsuneonella litorea]MCT2558700.1 Hpt domain-containing protein [Tsuneonella litorea]
MAYEQAAFDATIAAAAGEDPALFAELRNAFRDSLERHLDHLKRARCDGNWTVAAQRLRGLAASFHASELVELAAEAIEGAPGDPSVVRKIEQFRDHFVGA